MEKSNETFKYHVIKDSAMESVKAWVIQNYKHEVTARVMGVVSAEAETSADNFGAALASVELTSHETKWGYSMVYKFKEDDFIISED